MPQGPAPASPGRGEDPARLPREPVLTPDRLIERLLGDWMSGEDRQAWCDHRLARMSRRLAMKRNQTRRHLEYDLEQMPPSALGHRGRGRCLRARSAAGDSWRIVRGFGTSWWAARVRAAAPGEYLSRAAGFATGMLLDTMPGCNALAGFAAEAAGDDENYEGVFDDEVAG